MGIDMLINLIGSGRLPIFLPQASAIDWLATAAKV
jgi:hypothetical protein